jgi:hypothetical protein
MSGQDQALILFEKALSKVEKNMNALNMLIAHFEKTGYDKSQYTPQFQDMMGKFAKLMKEFTRTEYEYEGPYSAEQTQERYKASVVKSWKHRPERPANAEAPISEDDVRRAMQDRAEKLELLQAKRAKQRLLLDGNKSKPMITDKKGKQRYDAKADAASSDEDDEQIINRVIHGDPNPGKNDTARLRALRNAKAESNKKDDVNYRYGRNDPFYNEYSIDELDNIHEMHKKALECPDSDDEKKDPRQPITRNLNDQELSFRNDTLTPPPTFNVQRKAKAKAERERRKKEVEIYEEDE